MNGCGSLSVKLCIYQNRQQEGFGLWAIVCLLYPPCSTPPALCGGVLDGVEASFLPIWMTLHSKCQCVIMLQDPSPIELRVGNEKGTVDPPFLSR